MERTHAGGGDPRRARDPRNRRSCRSRTAPAGATRERTHDLVVGINRDTSMMAMAHLTCAAHTPRTRWSEIVTPYARAGIENILALGGDPPKDLELPPGELKHAIDLVGWCATSATSRSGWPRIRSRTRGRTSVEADRRHTAEKLARPTSRSRSSSSSRGTTSSSSRALHALGVDKPVIAGDHAGHQRGVIKRMSEMQGSEFPPGSPRSCTRSGTIPRRCAASGSRRPRSCATSCSPAARPGLHFYTLNRSTATREIYGNLGLVALTCLGP